MKFSFVIITCPGRETMLAQTIGSLLNTDFKAAFDMRAAKPDPATLVSLASAGMRLWIQRDETTFERRQERQEHNSLAALNAALNNFPAADVIVFCEDDIIFNRYLRHNLERWKVLADGLFNRREHRGHRDGTHGTDGTDDGPNGQFFFGSLYDPNVCELEAFPEKHYFVANPEAVYGSQCFVMSRAMAEYFIAHWWEVAGMQDIKMSRLAARVTSIFYHMPSLVQHVGTRSTWTDDNRFHDTKMYDENFKSAI